MILIIVIISLVMIRKCCLKRRITNEGFASLHKTENAPPRIYLAPTAETKPNEEGTSFKINPAAATRDDWDDEK